MLAVGVSAAALVIGSVTADAGSFALKERSARAQGLSFAGATSGSGGLSSMGFNPAAIGLVAPGFNNGEMSGGLSLVLPQADGQVQLAGVPTGETVEAGRLAGISNGYVGYRLEDDILIGLALYTPFGLATQYDLGWTGQGDALTSKLLTLTVAPTFAYEPMDGLTFALSANITYADARLTSSQINLEGHQTSYSFGAGVLYRPTDSTSIGVAYQHGYNLTLSGSAQGPGTGGAIVPVSASAELPSTISLGVTQGITDGFRLMGELQWQNWSVFDSIDITINGAINQSDPQNYDNAFFVAFGGEYDVSNDLTVRMGAAWDQTPTNSGTLIAAPITNRTARVPDEDRVWLSIGATYDVNDHMSLDFGYSYLFALEDAVVGLRTAPGNTVVYDGGAHIFSIGGSMKF